MGVGCEYTIAVDPSFTGESGGHPRYMASPDINTEDFMAAVDLLSVQDNVDAEKVGIIGICGWGGMALNTAAEDEESTFEKAYNGLQGWVDCFEKAVLVLFLCLKSIANVRILNIK